MSETGSIDEVIPTDNLPIGLPQIIENVENLSPDNHEGIYYNQ